VGFKLGRSSVLAAAGMLVMNGFALSHGNEKEIEARIEASRTAGVAPLAVFFDGTETGGLLDDDFVNASFTWDFDSSDADATGRRETTRGFLCAHVFEKPGTYTVAMKVRDAAGNEGEASVQISVRPFEGKTYYVSADGDDAGPGTMAQPFQTVNFAVAKAEPNTHILFRRGDTFSLASVQISDKKGPVLVGAYRDPGKPSDQAPIWQATGRGGQPMITLRGVHDWRFADLHLIGTSFLNEEGELAVAIGGAGSHILALRLEIERVGKNAFCLPGSSLGGPVDGLFIFDCHTHDLSNKSWFGRGLRLAIVGNRFEKQKGGLHVIRVASGLKTYIAYNELFTGDASTAIQIRNDSGRPKNEQAVVACNIADGNVGFRPVDKSAPAFIRYCLADGNIFLPAAGKSNFKGIAVISARDVAIRNNIFCDRSLGVALRKHPLMAVPDNVRIYHNTFYNSRTLDLQHGLVAGPGTRLIVKNNIVYSASRSPRPMMKVINFSGPADELKADRNLFFGPGLGRAWKPFTLAGNELALAEWQALGLGENSRNADPKFASTTMDDAEFLRLRADSPAIDMGEVLGVCYDRDGAVRPAGNGPDVGAHEFDSAE